MCHHQKTNKNGIVWWIVESWEQDTIKLQEVFINEPISNFSWLWFCTLNNIWCPMCRAKVKAAEKHRYIYVRLGWLGLLGAEVSEPPAVADGVEEPAVAGSTWVTAGSERGAALHQTGAAQCWSLGWRNRLRPGLRSLEDTYFHEKRINRVKNN